MSHQPLLTPIARKEVSRKEYSMLEEWAPQTLSAYHCPEITASLSRPGEAITSPGRRRKTRSSSVYEEWKSQALQKDNNTAVSTAPPGDENKQEPVDGTSIHQGLSEAKKKSQRQRRPKAGVSTVRNLPENHNAASSNQYTESADADGGYTAPTGIYIGKEELVNLSNGIKLRTGDVVYFQPTFVEDPWKGIQAIKTECLMRY
ncbi:hypothetical protein BDV59DRAFT_198638 [Aspergillus ambiguus]|uniref:uncharacterized protein n=1 Tax=Aspergillus ambiguus TaxID=176160 RepID=UPI003CCD05BC